MIIKEAKFIISNTELEKCPKPVLPEFAFIGRSNVGKSSLINMLTNFKGLAKTSGKPGKTRVINHFLINKDWFLVDLPGYGYAQVAKSDREKWEKFVRRYLLHRENLYCTFVLIDARLEAQPVDLEFMEWMGISNLPFTIVFTKADKLKPSELEHKIENYKSKLLETWEDLPHMVTTSATSAMGRDELLDYIEQIIKSEKE
jgi:GTP-binding protein